MPRAQSLHKLTPKQMWVKVTSNEEYPALSRLMKLLLKVPLDTSCCERWFSLMNRLKDKYRNRMSDVLLQNLMMICAHGPIHAKDFDMAAAVTKWKTQTSRGRYTGAWKEEMAPVANHMIAELAQLLRGV